MLSYPGSKSCFAVNLFNPQNLSHCSTYSNTYLYPLSHYIHITNDYLSKVPIVIPTIYKNKIKWMKRWAVMFNMSSFLSPQLHFEFTALPPLFSALTATFGSSPGIFKGNWASRGLANNPGGLSWQTEGSEPHPRPSYPHGIPGMDEGTSAGRRNS